MKEIVQHPTYGEIVYEENAFTGKTKLTVNGVEAPQGKKRTFSLGEKIVTVKGNSMFGAKLIIDDEEIRVIPAPLWYEVILALLPILFLEIWGNVPSLCRIFPVVGGAVGGALGAFFGLGGLIFMKTTKSPLNKVLFGLGAFLLAIAAGYLVALALLAAIA